MSDLTPKYLPPRPRSRRAFWVDMVIGSVILIGLLGLILFGFWMSSTIWG